MQKILQDVHIGANIQRLRKSRGYSQTDMVTKLQLSGRSMSRANYAHIEQGVRNIYVSDLILFKEIFDVDFEEFFKGLTPQKTSNNLILNQFFSQFIPELSPASIFLHLKINCAASGISSAL